MQLKLKKNGRKMKLGEKIIESLENISKEKSFLYGVLVGHLLRALDYDFISSENKLKIEELTNSLSKELENKNRKEVIKCN